MKTVSVFSSNRDLKILEMEALITEMEQQTDGWEIRSIMQRHAQLLDASANLASEAIEAEYGTEVARSKVTADENITEVCCKSRDIQ